MKAARGIERRVHRNGWISVVDGDKNGDLLVGYAVNATGEIFDALGGGFPGGDDDYLDRLRAARHSADLTVKMLSNHQDCSCPAWPDPARESAKRRAR